MIKLISTLAAMVLVSAGAFGQSLSVGDKAPALTVSKWVKGDEVKSFDEGRVYVVEFWATWCPPCLKSIPHLSKLQSEHAEHVTIIGMTSEDRRNTLAKVETFVDDWGDKMAYTVAWDNKRTTNSAYMAAAGQNGIPTAFVIDQSGILAWIGNPLDPTFDSVLEEVISGKFDGAAQKRKAGLQKKADVLMREAGNAYQAGDTETVLKKFDEIIALDNEVYGEVAIQKVNFMMFELGDVEGANEYAGEAVRTVLADQGMALNALAWFLVTDAKKMTEVKTTGEPDLDVALAAADRANELTEGANAAVLDTLAAVHWERGEKDEAITIAEKAVAAADEGERPALQVKLDTYRAD